MIPETTLAGNLSRRDFLWMASISTAGFLSGCAANPVTGVSQLMLISENAEIEIDRKNSPYQFSTDYGVTQDESLNRYVDGVGKRMVPFTHRPRMPYAFKVVNATYVNAYAFPGGSIACTRGILLKLENEAGLASLLGHEMGHVNARHTAQQMSKGVLAQALLSGAALYANVQAPGYSKYIEQLGMLGASALLAHYSRDNEREADELGMTYMVRSGYNPEGFIGLMEMLNSLSKRKPSSAEILFSTHPMSEERYLTARREAQLRYSGTRNQPLLQERYMDHTAGLRGMEDAIVAMQNGDKEMTKRRYVDAESHYQSALNETPTDYTALVKMAKCMLAQKKLDRAIGYAEDAKAVYPDEAQAHNIAGYIKIQKKRYSSAYDDFMTYEKLLPNNPNTLFFRGYCLEGMHRREDAARIYYQYLRLVNNGDKAQYAYRRLQQWGYIK